MLAILVAGSLAVGLAACGGDDDDDAAEGDTEAADTSEQTAQGGVSLECTDGRILVGIAKAESGVASFFDVAGTRGAKIAFDQINEEGGIKGCPIETIEGDTRSDPAVAAQVARSLIDQGAQILLVPDDFDLGIAAAKIGQEAGVLTLSTAASSTEFASAVGDLFFNAGPTTTQLGEAQAQFALDQGWTKTFFVVDEGLAYFTEQVETYTALYEAGGGSIVGTDTVDSLGGQADFSAEISQIERADPAPQVINVQMIFPNVGTFVKQLRGAGIDTPVLGNVTLQTRELPGVVGAGNTGDIYYAGQVYFEGAGVDPNSDPAIDEFAAQYEETFGNFPEQANGPGSFQTIWAINEALQREDVTDAGSAAQAIREQTNVAVPGGTLVRWEDGHAIWNITINALDENGEFQQVTVVEAE
ncbi:MAG: ABC transporter substrate-binding protein [Solirubrobacterales bacterium]